MAIPSFGPNTKISVGLLGGSFNPAHEGHVYISELAIKKLELDQVWWLVSPQNPLKSKKGMAPIEKRVKSAQKKVRNRQIQITTLETRLGTRYTADTLKALKRRYPQISFVWIMGADNLEGFHRWKEWRSIYRLCPMVVFHRPSYALKALASKAALRFKGYRCAPKSASVLKFKKPPAWVFLPIRGMRISATEIRQRLKDEDHSTF